MKRFLYAIIFLALSVSINACEEIKQQIEDYGARLTALEGTKIPSVEQQIQAVQSSILELKVMDRTLKEYINDLNQKDLPELKEAIKQLQAKEAELESTITELQRYVDSQLGTQKDWVMTTFSTLEQYQDLVTQMAGLKTDLGAFEKTVNDKFTEVAGTISALETSLKAWVNEAFTKYYDIATIDAKLAAIDKSIQDGDNTNKAAIDDLSTRVDKALNDMTIAYQKAISEAIETNNGVINQKIAGEIETVNKRIDDEVNALQKRIASLEDRVKAIEDYIDEQKKFSIDFDVPDDLVCYPGATVSIPFTLSDSSLETKVECVPDPGWKAVVSMGKNRGDITITASSEGGEGKILVFANRSTWTIMRALYVQEGVLRIANNAYQMPWQGGELEVTVTTNMQYELEFSGTSSSWISVAPETKATVREDVLTFQIAENGEDMPARDGIVILKNSTGDVLEVLIIHQEAQPTNNPIQFADSKLKERLVAAFDTSGDGELSYKEAAAVTSLEGVVTIKTVTSFDEFQYFTGVTDINNSLFQDWSKLSSIILPKSIINIGNSAFRGCLSLDAITIPEGVNSIGDSAFWGCVSLTTIVIPQSVVTIGNKSFSDCSQLSTIHLSEGIISIGSGAFSGCKSLKSITLPNSVSSLISDLHSGLFSGCSDLETIVLSNTMTSIPHSAFSDCISLSSITIPESVTSIGASAFSGCTSLKNIVIPDSVRTLESYSGWGLFSNCSSLETVILPNGITSIPCNAFYNCYSLSRISIPDSVDSIMGAAFYGCNSLITVLIPESVSTIGGSAFFQCSSLSTIVIPESVISIGACAFYGCSSIEKITIPESVIMIADSVFDGCTGLTSVTISGSVTSFGSSVFNNCPSLTDIILLDGVSIIWDSAFKNCSSLNSVSIPNSVTGIGDYAFAYCSGLSSVSIPDSVRSIGDYAFQGCSQLAAINIPDALTVIKNGVFNGCSSLESVSIPESVTSIGDYAFRSCTGLRDVTVNSVSPPSGGKSMFVNTNNCSIFVPKESVSLYRFALCWNDYASRIYPIGSDPEDPSVIIDVDNHVEVDFSVFSAEMGWVDGECYDYFTKGGVSFTAYSDYGVNGVFYASLNGSGEIISGDWRFYQARGGGLMITVPFGHELKKVTFTYVNKNGGVLVDSDGNLILSDSVYPISGQSAVFSIGSDIGATNGQVRIRGIIVECL